MSKKKSIRSKAPASSRLQELKQELSQDEGWKKLQERLPPQLQELAKTSGAVQKWRKLRRASDLLRLGLLYGLSSMGLRTVVSWAARAGLVRFSAEALSYRLSRSVQLLEQVLGFVLQQAVPRAAAPKAEAQRLRIVINDGSVLTLPGSVGTDLRIHAHFELPQQRLSDVAFSGPQLGERLDLIEAPAKTLMIGDMGLGRASGLHAVHQRSVLTLTRVHFHNIQLQDHEGKALDVEQVLARAERADSSTEVWVPLKGHEALRARLLVRPLAQEAAARARQKTRRSASKRSQAPTEEALRLAGYVCLLTTASEEVLSDSDAFRLYRLRWQIELAFKRYKSLLGLKKLHKANDPLLEVQLLAKLIVIALVEQLVTEQRLVLLSSSVRPAAGQQGPISCRPEPSLWRLTHLASIAMLGFLAGPSSWWYRCSSEDAALLSEGKRRRRCAHREIVTLAEKLHNPQVDEFMEEAS